MSTIEVIGDAHSSPLHLVYEAFVRSFSMAQVRKSTFGTSHAMSANTSAIVIVNPAKDPSHTVFKSCQGFGGRVILLGALSDPWLKALNLAQVSREVDPTPFACATATAHQNTQSQAVVHYSQHPLNSILPIRERPCCRFDFTNEWNNLGYGRIEASGPWGLSGLYRAQPENELAKISTPETAYAAIWDRENQSLLWWNREVGPLDSFEWTLVETFLNSYRPEIGACVPQFTEVPWGLSSAVTMRLDCDEDIQTSQALFQLYKDHNVPFSLAIKTSILQEGDTPFLNSILTSGGSILSHSHTHPENWGADLSQATEEALVSKNILEHRLNRPISAAVSPFHKNKNYSFEALAKAEYKAVVTGIIANDPEFLLAKAGAVPLASGISPTALPLLTHSQQCMFHGDCILLQTPDPLKVYKQAFAIAAATQTLFGYLDHPFSSRYQYGWNSETQRLESHANFIQHLKSHGARFLNEDDALDFLLYKAQSSVWLNARGQPCTKLGNERPYMLTVKWNGQFFPADEWTL